MPNVQSEDMPYVAGANPTFITATANTGVDYLAFDTSLVKKNIEQYISGVNDGNTTDWLMLPRWPANVLFNTINPDQLVDEYNYIFFTLMGNTTSGITAPGKYAEILVAEADTALRHMLTYKKWPHFFHQTSVAAYDPAATVQASL